MQKKEALELIEQNYKKLMILEGVRVSPELAKELLKRNIANRNVKRRTIQLYVQQMKANQWKFNGDTIKISKTGKLLDGQHRLISIEESKTTQTYNIQLGLEDETFDVMDVGKQRSASDTLQVAGYKTASILAAAIKIVYKYDTNKLKDDRNLATKDRLTNHQVKDWLETHKEDLMVKCSEKAYKYVKHANFLNSGTYCAFEYMFARKNESQAQEFMRLLSTGEDISSSKNSSVYLLRQKLINMRGEVVDLTLKHALLIKAWNLFREDKKVARLSWNEGEDFPKIK